MDSPDTDLQAPESRWRHVSDVLLAAAWLLLTGAIVFIPRARGSGGGAVGARGGWGGRRTWRASARSTGHLGERRLRVLRSDCRAGDVRRRFQTGRRTRSRFVRRRSGVIPAISLWG